MKGKRTLSEDESDADPSQSEEQTGSESEQSHETESDILDEEDLELIEENLGREAIQKSKSFKRIRKRKTTVEESEESSEDLSTTKPKTRDLENLFDEDDEESVEEEDLDDFIEEDYSEEEKTTIKEKTKPSKPRSFTMNREIMEEMTDIFGELLYDDDIIDDLRDNEFEPKSILSKQLPLSLLPQTPQKQTDQDRLIIETDIPERIQLLHGSSITPPTDEEKRHEAVWIASRLSTISERPDSEELRRTFILSVANILKAIRDEYLEPPYLISNRKDIMGDLSMDDVWSIYDLDAEWIQLDSRKRFIISLWEDIQKRSTIVDPVYIQDCFQSTPGIFEKQDLDDVYDFISFHFSSILSELSQPITAKQLQSHEQAIMKEFLSKFGINPKQYSINITDNYKRFEPEDNPISPETLAQSFLSDTNPSINHVMKIAIKSIAKYFGHDPFIRKSTRKILEDCSMITLIPTSKAIYELDSTHPYAPFLFITKKPFSEFMADQYLEICAAIRDGYITIQIDIEIPREYERDMESFIMSESYSSNSETWNPFRLEVLKSLLEDHLFPLSRDRVQSVLRENSSKWVAKYCEHALMDSLVVGSCINTTDDEWNSSTSTEKCIMSITMLDRDSPCMLVIIDSNGEVIDKTSIIPGWASKTTKDEEIKKIIEWMKKHEPVMAGVSGTFPLIRQLYTDIHTMMVSDDSLKTKLVYADDDSARIFCKTVMAKQEFGADGIYIAYGVSVARRMLDPAVELARLGCSASDDILKLKFHSFQDLVPTDILTRHYNRALINIVMILGVDLYRAIAHPFTTSLLPFVCGLGPRKASDLLERVKKMSSNGMITRKDIKDILGRRVYWNCASFIYIKGIGHYKKKKSNIDILDRTRIHPENYSLARKIAADALGITEPLDESDTNPSLHVEELMQNPEKLDNLLLDEYAQELAKRQKVQKRLVLYSICDEIKRPYHDHRTWSDITPDRLFIMLTGETDRSFRPGLITCGRVIKITDRSVLVHLDNGLLGTIFTRNLSDDRISHPSNVVHLQEKLVCRILQVVKDRFFIELSCRKSDIQSLPYDSHQVMIKEPDKYYDFERASSILGKKHGATKDIGGNASVMVPRAITHPLFKNVNRHEAEKLLSNAKNGDIVIRPGSKGPDVLVASIKLDEEVYLHIDIKESEKENDWSLGKVLHIGNEKFEDLDEVIARYVDPLYMHLEDAVMYPKYITAKTEEHVEEHLRKCKEIDPKRIAYCISISHKYPGNLMFSFLPGERVHHEYISLTPTGYRFRKQFFDHLNELINWFKKDYANMHNRPQKAWNTTEPRLSSWMVGQ